MLAVRESLLRWECVEAAHAEPLRGQTVPLPDLPQDLHLSEPPEEAPEEPLQHELSLTAPQNLKFTHSHVLHLAAAMLLESQRTDFFKQYMKAIR